MRSGAIERPGASGGAIGREIDPAVVTYVPALPNAEPVADEPPGGRVPLPLFATRPLGDPFFSIGPHVRRWAEANLTGRDGQPLRLVRWQRWALDRLLEIDSATCSLRFTEALLGVPRQQGKSTIARAVAGFALTSPLSPWVRTYGAGYDRQQAAIIQGLVLNDLWTLDPEQRVGRYTRLRGLRMIDGREYHVISKESASARGITADLVVLDELLTQKTDAVLDVLRPALTGAPFPFMMMMSTAGDDSSIVLRRYYEAGVAAATSRARADLGFLWWGADPEADSHADATIVSSNPLLAEWPASRRRRYIARERAALTLESFGRERLNRWQAGTSSSALPPGAWAACADLDATMPDVVMVGVDIARSWGRATIAVAGRAPDGRIVVGIERDLVAPDGGTLDPDLVAAELASVVEEFHPALVGYDPQSATRALVERLGELIPFEAIAGSAFAAASMAFGAAVVGGTVVHNGDPLMGDQLRTAARSATGETWRWTRSKSLTPIDAVCAVTIAHDLAARPIYPGPGIF